MKIVTSLHRVLQLQTAAKTAGINHEEWMENADRWVAGFLEKFEEGCHIMVSCLKTFCFCYNYNRYPVFHSVVGGVLPTANCH